MNKQIILVTTILITTIIFTAGCGQKENINFEKYVEKHPAVAETIEDAIYKIHSEDMDIDISYLGNLIVVNGTLKTEYSDRILDGIKESIGETQRGNAEIETAIKKAEEVTGIPDISIEFRINNGDGRGLWSERY